jgi:hypothetical protein
VQDLGAATMDIIAILFGIAIFALLILYVPACEKV